jgi:lipoyl(octanoyl) transferase
MGSHIDPFSTGGLRAQGAHPAPATIDAANPIVRRKGLVEYTPTMKQMREVTLARVPNEPDQLWLLQHPAVYTLGLAARTAHSPRSASGIPVVKSDRGGQITYHGPGQLIVYTLIDLRRLGIGVRQLVRRLEQSVIDLLGQYDIPARGDEGAPGVYVDDAKIAALGLRIRKGCSYHGLSLNVDMDLAPFDDIDPCGYPGLRVSQLRDLGIKEDINSLGEQLLASLQAKLWGQHPMETR